MPTANTYCLPDGVTLMVHPGMPPSWGWVILIGVVGIALYALFSSQPTAGSGRFLPLARIPLLGALTRFLNASPWPLVVLRMIAVMLFLAVIAAGLWGTPLPERNLATTLTWTLWWTLVVISVFFIGTAWCAICPWDALAVWLNRRRLWRRGEDDETPLMRLPRPLRTVWPALFLFVGLTWLELGMGVTLNPAATAILALVMVVLATSFLALFERKSFCRYFCPVGRTLGFYAQLAPLELRPLDPERCRVCTTLECYHGSVDIEPCPTFLTMGRFSQNTYCLSCGSCVLSCPAKNVSWRLRPLAAEALTGARPHWDEAWFMVVLLALTAFHGITMMPFWEETIRALAPYLGDKGQLLRSFTLGMGVCLAVPAFLYGLAVEITRRWSKTTLPFRRLFASLSFATLPVAFAYHLAHNLNHLTRESSGIGRVLRNPLGTGTLPISSVERHARMLDLLVPENVLFFVQAGLFLLGYWLAVRILRQRGEGRGEKPLSGGALLPMVLFLGGCTGFNVWLVVQSMVMRL